MSNNRRINTRKLSKLSATDESNVKTLISTTKSSNMNEKSAAEKKSCAIRERIMKKIAKRQQKNVQPSECMKFIEVEFHPDIEINFDFYQETVAMLDSASIPYSINSSQFNINNCITWKKLIEEYSISDANDLNINIKKECEKCALIIWKWDEVVKKIYNKTFTTSIKSISISMPKTRLTLVIYGIERYFEYYKSHAKQNNKISYTNIEMMGIPKISVDDLELSLIDVQLDSNWNVRLIENPSDMSLLIYQYTKAIAERTYKSEINKRLYDQIDFFAAGDNKKTIKVDSNGYGLKNLWLKQLCMFNSSSLTTADAINSIYPSPSELINAYINCSCAQTGNTLLKDIQIKKVAGGPLAKVRKLGPELSKKIFTMFTSTNGEQSLS